MKPQRQPVARHDPELIYAVHASRAAGLTVAEIATRHGLSLPIVLGFLRSPADSCALLGPFAFQRAPHTESTPIHVYWLGFIAACGRLFNRGHHGTLVMAIHPDDSSHVGALVADLVVGHSTCEFADSNLSGRQAYIRNPGLARVLVEWGIAETPEQGSISMEYIPKAFLADFFRGYLEGSRESPPFGGAGRRSPSPRTRRPLTLVGNAGLMGDLRKAVREACGVAGGTVTESARPGLLQLTFSPDDSDRLLAWAYRTPVRSTPRAGRYVARFAPAPRATARPKADLPAPG